MTSLQNPEDVINVALVRIGWKNQIGSVWEGSEAAQLSLSIYGQTRDTLMRDGDWGFCQRNVALTLLKSAPGNNTYLTPWTSAYPPLPWAYEYAYNDDILKVRAVKPTPFFIPNFDPQPFVFAIDNDNSFTPPQRVILCNVADAICVYAGRVTDPTTWPSDFAELLTEELGKRLGPALAGLDAAKVEAAESTNTSQMAKVAVG